jgi:hypothetical protein
MKKTYPFILLISFSLLTSFSVAASFTKGETPKSVTVDSADYKLADFMNVATKDVVKSTGKKITIFDQISLYKMRLNMKKVLKKDPNTSVSEYYSKLKNRRMGAGWAFLIFFVGLLLILSIIFLILMSNARWG